MKRFYALAVLMLLGSPAYAGESFSFVIGGHHIHIEAPRHCNSASCVSVSIPGVYEKRGRRDRYDDDYADAPAQPSASVVPPASPSVQSSPVQIPPAQTLPPQSPRPAPLASIAPPASPPPAQPVACVPVPAPAPVPPAAAVAPQVVAPPQPQSKPSQIQPPKTAAITPAPPSVDVAPAPAPRISKVVHETEEEPTDTPLGDWQTEGQKGMVRIEPCGQALCGYVLDPSSSAKGETVLIDMKSKTAAKWSGNIYSRDSGNTYYATMSMTGRNSLRVEACAVGRFFCSGNVWNRLDAKPERLITYRQIATGPRS